MIVSIHHKGLRQLWEEDDWSALPFDQLKKIRAILEKLNAAESLKDINIPGFGLHLLKGDLSNYWSVIVKANWRIIFRFENGNAYEVNYLDYH